MTAYTKSMITLVVIMLGITGAVIWTIQDRFFKHELLTVHEAALKLESLYGGTVESFEQNGDQFFMEFERSGIIYNIQINANTGDVSDLTRVNTKEATEEIAVKTNEEIRLLLMAQNIGTIQSITLKGSQYVVKTSTNQEQKTIIINAITGTIISETVTKANVTPPTSSTIITKTQAQQIALSQLKGEVEYVVYEESGDGGYYLVEIEGTTKKAVFQIQAISGKVLSVTQSDYNKPSDDEDDLDDSEDLDDDKDNDTDETESNGDDDD